MGSFTLVVIVFVAVVGLRVVAVSDWNFDLVGGVLSGVSFTDLPSLVLSILLTNKHDAIMLLLSVAAYFFVGSVGSSRAQRAAVALAIFVVAAALNEQFVVRGYEQQVVVFVALIVLAGILGTVLPVLFDSDAFDALLFMAKLIAVTATFICATNIATSKAPWVPRECIYQSRGMPVSGWVIGESVNSQWLRVLTDTKPRALDLVRINETKSRKFQPQGKC